MAIYDYSGINWANVTADQLIDVMEAANAAGDYLDSNFYQQAVNNLSVETPSNATRIFYAGTNPVETGEAQAWQVAQNLTDQNSEEFRRLDDSDLGKFMGSEALEIAIDSSQDANVTILGVATDADPRWLRKMVTWAGSHHSDMLNQCPAISL